MSSLCVLVNEVGWTSIPVLQQGSVLFVEVERSGRGGEPESLEPSTNNLEAGFTTEGSRIVAVVFQQSIELLQLLLIVAEDWEPREEVIVPLRYGGAIVFLSEVPGISRSFMGDSFFSDPPRIRVVPTRSSCSEWGGN